jgi:hypothetical protein
MSADDELAIPEVPEAKPEDPEDVSWALSTAEAMWARGDHLEGIKWVRKAAEAASEVEDDARALELAKAASELATIIARRSRASLGDGSSPTVGGYVEPGAPAAQRSPAGPKAPESGPPPGALSASRSIPPSPIPLPSRASSAPQGPATPRAAPRPLATSDARQGPQPGRGVLSSRTAPESSPKSVRGRRRSRENLEAEAKEAGVTETPGGGDNLAVTAVGAAIEIPTPAARARRRSRSEPEPTVVGRVEDLIASERGKSAAEWDASPTQNLSGDEMDRNISMGDRATTAFALPTAPALAAPPPAPRAPASTLHDPEIQTSQAVRVVVWRDASGVHLAPAGTVVSAITIDAVLVALEPSADLTAWLSQRER